MGLSPEKLKELLEPKPVYEPTPQNGPLRWYDREMRCCKKGCGSSTYCKIEHKPFCMKHALDELNKLCIQVTELRLQDLQRKVAA